MSTPADEMPPASVTGYVTTQPPVNPRQTSLVNLAFQPGVASNNDARSLQGRWKDSNRIRWHKGQPEKILGWAAQTLTGANNGVIIGTVRGAWDWATLDGQQWIAVGTECKLYLINQGVLYDITPIRQTSNLKNALSTVNGTNVVTVIDPLSFVNPGDHVSFPSPGVTIGGLTLLGDYDVSNVEDANTWQFEAGANATSTVTNGGGVVTINYDIHCGLANNGFLYGYGTGEYGESTYGTARTTGNGIAAPMRCWTLQNFGQDLLASYTNGELYLWDPTTGPNSRATIIANAPTSIQTILVNPDAEFVIAVGCTDIDGNPDPMNVRWCVQGDFTTWLPVILPTPNTAGGQRLNYGSTMVAAVNAFQQNLLWSDTWLYAMQFINLPNIFGFTEIGKTTITGPNAVIEVNGITYWMGFTDFFTYNGTLNVLPCDVWEYVYGPNGTFDPTQAQAVYAASYQTKSEVTWYYPGLNSTGVHYVTWNYQDECWYYGLMSRTCMRDVSTADTGYYQNPYGFNDGIYYIHETGYDEVEPSGTNAMDYWLESWDIGMQSDDPVLINSIVPGFPISEATGQLQLFKGLQFTLVPKEYPNQPDSDANMAGDVGTPAVVTPTTTKVDYRAKGSQVALLIEAAKATFGSPTPSYQIVYGQWFRMGTWQAQSTPYGKRIDAAYAGDPIDTSGP